LAAGVAIIALAGCGGPPRLHADQAWVRLAAVPGAPAAAYFTLHGGEEPAVLAGVATDAAVRAEMHQSMASGPMTTMRPLARVDVPPEGEVDFAPGGRHVMLFDVDPRVKPGSIMPLQLRYAGGETERVLAQVVGAGDPAPR
jgi:hypothetical protein